ncbi:aldo/keto reductase [Streptomyces sp. P6-2-1]|uniref:aldo/keto reductase n=1 Tax=Streptomyces sp. P6-2-1 TaxID=3422591 RepID=UPI003D35D876
MLGKDREDFVLARKYAVGATRTEGHARLGNFPARRVARGRALAERHGWAPVSAVTHEYGVAEREVIPMAEALGIGFGAWSPLGSGFLTGAGTEEPRLPHRARTGRPTGADLAVREAVAEVAARHGATRAQVGLAWVLGRARRSPTGIAPVTSAPTAGILRDNLRALELELTAEDMDRLDGAGGSVLGEPHDHNRVGQEYVTAPDLIRPVIPAA